MRALLQLPASVLLLTALALFGGRATHAATLPDPPVKRALVIAIADYPDGTGWTDLSSANDVPLIRHVLEVQGFTDVRVLSDGEATRDGIEAAMADLVARSKPGDVVVVHYSGHGATLRDNDGDELDGYDEALVPHGARLTLRDGETTADVAPGYLRDDDLGQQVLALRRRAGREGHVTVWLDACHSGTATRNAAGPKPRGTLTPVGEERRATPPDPLADTGEAGGMLEQAIALRSRGAGGSENLASLVVLSASRHDQLNYETVDERQGNTPVGSLSLALNHTLASVGPRTTYRMVFEEIRARIAADHPHQTPQIEGDVDVPVFGGVAVAQEPFIRVRQDEGDRSRSADTVVLEAGAFMGLLPGAEVALYPARTARPEDGEALATGTVARTTPTTATVRLATPLPDDSGAVIAFVTRPVYGDLTLRLALDDRLPETLVTAVRTLIETRLTEPVMLTALVDDPAHADLVLRPDGSAARGSAASYTLATAADGLPVTDALTTATASASLENALREYARTAYLRAMPASTAANIDVAMEILPAVHDIDEDGYYTGRSTVVEGRSRGGTLVFAPGEGYLLRARNDGPDEVYVAVLSLMPDGSIGQFVPYEGYTTAEAMLRPGQTVEVPIAVEDLPGAEVIRLFAAEQPLDFGPLLTRRSRSTSAGPASPLETLFEVVGAGTRSRPLAPPPGNFHSVTITIETIGN